MPSVSWIVGVAIAAVVAACSGRPSGNATGREPLGVELLTAPASPGSLAVNLSAGPSGRVYLTWLEPSASGSYRFRFAVRERTGPWSQARTIVEGADLFANWADTPSLLSRSNGELVAHWSGHHQRGTEAAYLLVARSSDEGRTWSEPVMAHTDRSLTQHGFMSLVETRDERVHALWLDGRHTRGEGVGDMGLMHAVISTTGPDQAEQAVDTRVCDCCPTAVTAVDDGLIVAYRDRSPSEVRDISVARLSQGTWSDPVPVSRDGWTIAGCPVNGPSVAAAGSRVAVAWFAAAGEPRVSLAFSDDGGRTFATPTRIPTTNPLGRVGVGLLPDGATVITWIDQHAGRNELLVQRVDAQARPDRVWRVGDVSGRSHPRMAITGREITFAWLDESSPAGVRTARLAP